MHSEPGHIEQRACNISVLNATATMVRWAVLTDSTEPWVYAEATDDAIVVQSPSFGQKFERHRVVKVVLFANSRVFAESSELRDSAGAVKIVIASQGSQAHAEKSCLLPCAESFVGLPPGEYNMELFLGVGGTFELVNRVPISVKHSGLFTINRPSVGQVISQGRAMLDIDSE